MWFLNMMVVYRGLNNVDSLLSLTTHSLQLYQMACLCANVAVFQLSRPRVLTVCGMRIFMSRRHLTCRFPWRFPWETQLKRSHKYYTQTEAQMWNCGVWHGFFIVWTQGGPLCMSELNLTWNFVLMLWTILQCFTSHLYFLACWGIGTFLIAQSDFSPAKENSICCDTCSTWWHFPGADLTIGTADAMDSWVCKSCLTDAAKVIDSNNDLEFNFAQESEEPVIHPLMWIMFALFVQGSASL